MLDLNKLSQFDPIRIEWVDISEKQGWHDIDEDISDVDMVCVTVGQYLKHDKNTLTIISCRTSDSYGNRIKYPMGCLVSVRKLK